MTEPELRVMISKEKYDDLLDSEMMLIALQNAGVDNWGGYDYALEYYEEMKNEQ